MQKYDLTVLVKTDTKDELKDQFVDKIEKTVKAADGVVGKFTEMGRKQLAYPIAKTNEAIYLSWMLEIDPKNVLQLQKKLTIDRQIMRYLLVSVE